MAVNEVTPPVLPAFGRGCITDLVPGLLGGSKGNFGGKESGLPLVMDKAQQRVLLLVDGLGWEQLSDRWELAPNLKQFEGGAITTVAPSTTATALTSLATGLTPGEHGIVGYRMVVDGSVLNCLRWGTTETPDARKITPPELVQPYDAFLGQSVAMVSKAEFRTTGFTKAHLRGARLCGYRTSAVLVHETARLLTEGERFVYAYYDGIDKVAHEYGLGSVYDSELRFVDRMVGDLLAAVPSGTQVVVVADHGQVDCRHGATEIADEVMSLTAGLSGEGRFRWLHVNSPASNSSASNSTTSNGSASGSTARLLEVAQEAHGHHAWVRSQEQMIDEKWFGSHMTEEARSRLGDVALVPFEPISFHDPADSGPFELIGRHGSLTSAEMAIPLLGKEA